MELSAETRSILNNFASINQNMLFLEGNVIKTLTEGRNVQAEATIKEEFPRKFGIYDLSEFLGVLNLVDTPSILFDEDNLVVGDKSGRTRIKYFYSVEESLTFPTKNIVMPSEEVSFVLDNTTFSKIKKAASTLGHEHLSIVGSEGTLTLSLTDLENKTKNTFAMDIDSVEDTKSSFNFIINIQNVKIIPGDYTVTISSRLISNFKNKEIPLQYWIACEKESTFNQS